MQYIEQKHFFGVLCWTGHSKKQVLQSAIWTSGAGRHIGAASNERSLLCDRWVAVTSARQSLTVTRKYTFYIKRGRFVLKENCPKTLSRGSLV